MGKNIHVVEEELAATGNKSFDELIYIMDYVVHNIYFICIIYMVKTMRSRRGGRRKTRRNQIVQQGGWGKRQIINETGLDFQSEDKSNSYGWFAPPLKKSHPHFHLHRRGLTYSKGGRGGANIDIDENDTTKEYINNLVRILDSALNQTSDIMLQQIVMLNWLCIERIKGQCPESGIIELRYDHHPPLDEAKEKLRSNLIMLIICSPDLDESFKRQKTIAINRTFQPQREVSNTTIQQGEASNTIIQTHRTLSNAAEQILLNFAYICDFCSVELSLKCAIPTSWFSTHLMNFSSSLCIFNNICSAALLNVRCV